MVFVYLYLIAALATFACYALPPTKYAQSVQKKMFHVFAGRLVWMWFLIVFCSMLWPVVVYFILFDPAIGLESYE